MTPATQRSLQARVESAAGAALEAQGYVSAIDVLTRIGWLAPSHVKLWQTGQLESLDGMIQVNPPRLEEAIRLLGAWASGKGLVPSETEYLARTPERAELRFTRSGDPTIERAYRTHWVSPQLPERRRQRLEQKLAQPPELVVIEPLHAEWKCHRCGGAGDFLIMEQPGPACLKCVGLDRLTFLPAGDAALSRRAKAKSAVHAVVVRFSRARRRYERQGLLVEPEALREAERELGERDRSR